jgi:hypothetical protein
MNAQIVKLDTSVHRKVQQLLPWAVQGQLGAAEQQLVEDHAGVCSQCRDDLAWQRTLQGVPPAAGAAPDLEAALARLLPRLDARPAAGARRWMRWALAAQLLLIAGLGAQLARQHEGYRLLGAPGAAGANLVVMFRPETSERQLRASLEASAAQVVGGPTVVGAWVLQVPPPRLGAALATLRADPAVALAEPLQADGPQ